MVTGGGAAPPGTVTEPLPSVIVLSAGRKMAAAAAAASGPGCSSAAGAGAAGVSEWLVLRDGCMRCDSDGLHSLSYHPALNAILAVTSRGTIKVIDGTSGATLQASALSGECAARWAGAGPAAGGAGPRDAGEGSRPAPGLGLRRREAACWEPVAEGRARGSGLAVKGGPETDGGGPSDLAFSAAAAGKERRARPGVVGVAFGALSVRCRLDLWER